jgi:hypothetical protein
MAEISRYIGGTNFWFLKQKFIMHQGRHLVHMY